MGPGRPSGVQAAATTPSTTSKMAVTASMPWTAMSASGFRSRAGASVTAVRAAAGGAAVAGPGAGAPAVRTYFVEITSLPGFGQAVFAFPKI